MKLLTYALIPVFMFSCFAIAEDNTPPEGFTALFNGKNLENWKGLVSNPVKRAKMSEDELVRVECDWCKGTGLIQCPKCGGTKRDPMPPFGTCCNCDDQGRAICIHCTGQGYNVYVREPKSKDG